MAIPGNVTKPIRGTTLKDGAITLKKGYSFVRISESEIAVAKITSGKPAQKGGVSTRRYTAAIMGSFECRCKSVRGSCYVNATSDPFNNIMVIHGCEIVSRCRRGCEFIVHFANTD